MVMEGIKLEVSCMVKCCFVYVGIQYGCYIKMVKRRIILFACLFLEVLLIFLVGKYGRLPAE